MMEAYVNSLGAEVQAVFWNGYNQSELESLVGPIEISKTREAYVAGTGMIVNVGEYVGRSSVSHTFQSRACDFLSEFKLKDL